MSRFYKFGQRFLAVKPQRYPRKEPHHLWLVDRVDVSRAIGALKRNTKHFSDLTGRQTYAGTAHPDSETIYLRMPPELTLSTMFNSLEAVDYPLIKVPEFADLVYTMTAKVKGRLARVMLVKLKAGGRIHPHIDQGPYAEATDRYHLPIVTNSLAWLRSGGDKRHLGAGEIWWFNKHAMHEGANNGPTDRVHLIVDYFKVAA